MEDSTSFRRLVSRVLRDEGHDVIESANGLAAYDKDLLSSLDLLITDLVMPRVDGLDVIRTALGTRDDLKVVAMSGARSGFHQDYLEVASIFGARDVLYKPFEPDTLINVVNNTLAA